jgi:citrate lyase subunit beta/citryl-CoA lyase
MLEKIARLGADVFVVDLEDGVAPDEKSRARDHVREVAASGVLSDRRWALRVNAVGTRDHEHDLDLVAAIAPPIAVLPKVEDVDAVAGIAGAWAGHGTSTALMIETPRGVGRVRELSRAHPRVVALLYGSADLRLGIGAPPAEDRGWERHAMSEIVLAARMHGCLAIDAVHFRFRDLAALEHDASIARAIGFDGKSCIHPGQIETIHRVFQPSDGEVAWAEQVLRAWHELDGQRRAVVVVGDEMIEALHVVVARRILDRADTS